MQALMRAFSITLIFLFSAASHAVPILPNIPAEVPALNEPPRGLVKRSKRVQVLRASGLEQDIAHMDELDRDLLVLAATNKSAEDLAAKYPRLEPAKLKKMQDLLRVAQ